MVRFMFWNIQRKRLRGLLLEAIHSLHLDGLFLAEADSVSKADLVTTRRTLVELTAPTHSKVRFFANQRSTRANAIWDGLGSRHRIVSVRGARRGVTFALAHLPSKRTAHEEERAEAVRQLVERINKSEVQTGLPAVVVGDLNMNPYERPLRDAAGLHGLLAASSAVRSGRRVNGRTYQKFYNPMWSLMGDRSDGPPGTYYRLKGQFSLDWHTYDQILLRPSLTKALGVVRILDTIGSTSLHRSGRPTVSDHFPLYFELDL